MDADVTLLHQKIDALTLLVEAQRQQLDVLQNHTNDQLFARLDYLVEQAEAQRRFQDEIDELRSDLTPIANHMIKLSINELAEIGSEFQAEDLWFLLKRLLRDTHLLVEGLNRLEMLMDFYDETQRGGKEVFNHLVSHLDQMEQQGYFAFARGSWRIVERIVTEFSEEDVNALGDNIVTILTTVKSLTQPEIMALTNRALGVLQTPEEQTPSLWVLLKDLSDPKVRRGLGRLIKMMRVLADHPETPGTN
jgi:uncharacterized protein YjgD (DUF1641 family)